MKTYKIIIESIEEKTLKKTHWVQVDPYKLENGEIKNYDYRTEEAPEEVETVIYTQRIDKEIDLKKVIDALND